MDSVYKEYLDSELASESERSVHSIAAQVARYGALKFGVLTISHPFDSARLLRQIQYQGTSIVQAFLSSGGDDEGILGPYPSTSFSTDAAKLHKHKDGRIGDFYAAGGDIGTTLPSDFTRDPSGYIVQERGQERMQAASQWPLQLDKSRSLWNSISQISHQQGLFSIWHGIFSAWTHDILVDLGRATIEEALEGTSFLTVDRQQLPFVSPELQEELIRPSLITGLAQGIVGLLLSPLEMIRVRLMAQSVWVTEQKYGGIICGLRVMHREETGFIGLFRNPVLTFASYFLTPILRIAPITLLSHFVYAPTESTSFGPSTAWLLTQNLAMCLPLLVTMPLETIRRRLMVQCVSPSGRAVTKAPYVTRVNTSPIPYAGAINCLWRMLREEGVSSLYQGWGFQIASLTASFAATLLADIGEEDLAAEDDPDGF